MHKMFKAKAYEMRYGPHFNEEYAHRAVSKLENEDGTHGPHWSIEESIALANQHGVTFNGRFNKYDWFVALNMVYSDYCKVITSISRLNNNKLFVDFAKAWLNDKDIDEGKMWYYYIYIMCDKIREEEMECYEDNTMEDEDYKYRTMNKSRRYEGFDDDMDYRRPSRYIR